MRLVLPALLAVLALPVPLPAQTSPTAGKGLHTLFEAEWERGLRENPAVATYLGDTRYNDR